jgi:hypothetical protein
MKYDAMLANLIYRVKDIPSFLPRLVINLSLHLLSYYSAN